MSSKKVLIYGGRGGLGTVLVSHFKAKGWWVCSIDLVRNAQWPICILSAMTTKCLKPSKALSWRSVKEKKKNRTACIANELPMIPIRKNARE
jgi:nucleoside-diphosphate-sugar epimerase